MSETAKVAVIMPSFNRPTLVQKAIKSIQAQTFKDWRLYIMDNSSPELWPRMKEIYSKCTEADSRIVVDHTKVANEDRYKVSWIRHVYNKAMFEGIVGGEPYIQLSTDDALMSPNKLEVLAGYLDSHPEVGMVAGLMELIDGTGKVVWTFGKTDRHITGVNIWDWLQPMFRRDVLVKAGKLAGPYGFHADIELFTRASKFHSGLHGLQTVLDRQYKRTKGQRHDPRWREKGLRGEVME